MQKVLIIEDDHAIRKQMAQVLRFEGFDPLEAADGKLGVASALKNLPDLIICDILMPEMDGFGVLQALRDNPRTMMTPFIFLTALAGLTDRRRGMAEGADDYITKPFQAEALLASVRRRLEKRRRQNEESRLRAEEVSLAVATLVPEEILGTLDFITTVTNLLALKYAAGDTEVAAMHEAVARESVRLRRMIRRLHLYAQLPQLYARRFELTKSGQIDNSKESIERIAHEVSRTWRREPDLTITAEQVKLPLCEEYLGLLVEELVDNACKFSPSGTTIEVQGTVQRAFWSLAVSNRGEGLSAEQIARMGAFKQFWSGNKKPQGLGLGLALTQGIARLHGCEFTIQSEAGVTTATILVPLEF
jgi:CheY-like chemotaxis protein